MELPLIDLCPMLRKSPDILVKVFDPYGWQPILAMNHLYPPFDNLKLRRALLPAIDQRAFVEAIVGEQKANWDVRRSAISPKASRWPHTRGWRR